jgi:YqaJ-like viral recombinase domain
MAVIKSGEAAARRNLRIQLVLERITHRSQENDYQSRAMEIGIEREADARAEYSALTGNIVEQSGFLAHPELLAGCSLDGHVGNFDLLVELKCPQPGTHYGYLRSGIIPTAYQWQIVHSLWLTGARACDWLSFCPDFPEPLRTRLVTVKREHCQLEAYEQKVRSFLSEVDRELETLNTLASLPATFAAALSS